MIVNNLDYNLIGRNLKRAESLQLKRYPITQVNSWLDRAWGPAAPLFACVWMRLVTWECLNARGALTFEAAPGCVSWTPARC